MGSAGSTARWRPSCCAPPRSRRSCPGTSSSPTAARTAAWRSGWRNAWTPRASRCGGTRRSRPGVTYDRVIERALVQADCVVVLWSAHAVESDWVRAEADEGRRRGILVPGAHRGRAAAAPVPPHRDHRPDRAGWPTPSRRPSIGSRMPIARHAPPLDPMARWREALVGEPAMDRRRRDPRSSWVSAARFVGTAARSLVTTGDGALSRYSVPGPGAERSSVAAHHGAIWSCAAGARAVADRRHGQHGDPGVGPGDAGARVASWRGTRPGCWRCASPATARRAGLRGARRLRVRLGPGVGRAADRARRAPGRGVVGGADRGERPPRHRLG